MTFLRFSRAAAFPWVSVLLQVFCSGEDHALPIGDGTKGTTPSPAPPERCVPYTSENSNADGVPEVWFDDTDQQVGFDAGYADPEQDGVWAGPYDLTPAGASATVLGGGVIGGGSAYGGITVLGPNGQALTDAEWSALHPGYATIGGGTYASTGNLQVDILIAQASNALIETILAPPCNYSYNGCA